MTDNHPWFVPGLRYTGEQTKGACILPKVFVIVTNIVTNIVINFVIIVISLIVL